MSEAFEVSRQFWAYLIEQKLFTVAGRAGCCPFLNAKNEDWNLVFAGQRVQIIKKDPERGGILEFGTEVVNSQRCWVPTRGINRRLDNDTPA